MIYIFVTISVKRENGKGECEWIFDLLKKEEKEKKM